MQSDHHDDDHHQYTGSKMISFDAVKNNLLKLEKNGIPLLLCLNKEYIRIYYFNILPHYISLCHFTFCKICMPLNLKLPSLLIN